MADDLRLALLREVEARFSDQTNLIRALRSGQRSGTDLLPYGVAKASFRVLGVAMLLPAAVFFGRWGYLRVRVRPGHCRFCRYPTPEGAAVCPECGRGV